MLALISKMKVFYVNPIQFILSANNAATNPVPKSLSEHVTKLDKAMDLAYTVTGRKRREDINRGKKYRYYKNHFTPGGKDQLYQQNITKKGQAFSFNYKWLFDHPWHVYGKE